MSNGVSVTLPCASVLRYLLSSTVIAFSENLGASEFAGILFVITFGFAFFCTMAFGASLTVSACLSSRCGSVGLDFMTLANSLFSAMISLMAFSMSMGLSSGF